MSLRTKSHHKASCGHGLQWCEPAPPSWTQRQQSPHQTAAETVSAVLGWVTHEVTHMDCAHPGGCEGIRGWGVRRGILPHLFDDCRKSSWADCCVPRALVVILVRSLAGHVAVGKNREVSNVRLLQGGVISEDTGGGPQSRKCGENKCRYLTYCEGWSLCTESTYHTCDHHTCHQ